MDEILQKSLVSGGGGGVVHIVQNLADLRPPSDPNYSRAGRPQSRFSRTRMQQLTRLQILCFLRFSMPNLLIGLVLVVAGVYGLVTAMPPVESLPFVSFADYRLVYGLGTALGGAFAGFGIRSGLESIRYDGED